MQRYIIFAFARSVREQKIKDIDNDKKRLAETKNDISDVFLFYFFKFFFFLASKPATHQ